MAPIIFLDFDGVLNTERHQARLITENKSAKDAWGPLFDPQAIANLHKIIEATDAVIVISSSWRYIHSPGSLRLMWATRDLPGTVSDIIPPGATYISRGEEIDLYLERAGRPNYVIIDDLDDFSATQHKHYVETNPITGISSDDTIKAIKILSGR